MNMVLYTRHHCPLCREAETLLAEAGLGDHVQEVEVDDDPALVRRYGNHVPVVVKDDTGEKLVWPFTASQVRALADVD